MNRERHKRNYDLHSWTGIALGVIVFVVAFTGCFALFVDEIGTWEDPALRLEVPEDPVAMDATFAAWVFEKNGGESPGFSRLFFPSKERPYYLGYVISDEDRQAHTVRWNATTGEPIAERGHGLSIWLLDIHRDFMWPKLLGGGTVGSALVGVAGIVLMLAMLTGVVAHTKIREEAYSMRLKRSQRLKWQDSHKVIGLWGLPFFIMIAFTGAVLGIIALLAPIVAAIAFKGDVEALEHAIFGEHAEPTGVQVQMISLDELRQIRHSGSNLLPEFISIEYYGDEAAVFNSFYAADTELLMYEVVSRSGVSGDEVVNAQMLSTTPATRATGAMAPLHYATYGGVWLKFLYAGMGLGLALITALGSMMWVERRKHGNEGSKSAAFYDRLSHFNTGLFLGLPIASLALFYLDKVYFGAAESRLVTTGWTYFAVWGAGLVYAFLRRNDYSTTRELMALVGVMALGIPVLNGAVTGDWMWQALSGGYTMSAWVDFSFMVLGASTLGVAYYLPKARQEKPKRARDTGSGETVEAVPAE